MKTTGKYRSHNILRYNVLRKIRGGKSNSQIANETGTTAAVVGRLRKLAA